MHLSKIDNPSQLIAIIKSLTAGSFERKHRELSGEQIVSAFAFATQGLNQEQLQTGIKTVLEKGFCPDAALFRQWCLGNVDFRFDDEIADSYTGKNAALGKIIKWLDEPKTTITQAQKQAYDETCHLWTDILSKQDRQRAEAAFKDAYEHIVKGLVKQRIACQIYRQPALLMGATEQKVQGLTGDELDKKLAELAKITGRAA